MGIARTCKQTLLNTGGYLGNYESSVLISPMALAMGSPVHVAFGRLSGLT